MTTQTIECPECRGSRGSRHRVIGAGLLAKWPCNGPQFYYPEDDPCEGCCDTCGGTGEVEQHECPVHGMCWTPA